MALAPCLIFGVGPIPAMGVFGAAVAMNVGRGLGVLYQASVLVRRRGHLAIGRRHLALRFGLMRELAKLATPASGQVLVETASWLGLVRIISTYGSPALAGYTIAMRVAIFALLPSWGLAQAAAALVGQNLGARSPERARRSVWTIARYNVAFLGPVGALFVIAPGVIVAFFASDPVVGAFAVDCLRIVAVGFVVFAFGMVARGRGGAVPAGRLGEEDGVTREGRHPDWRAAACDTLQPVGRRQRARGGIRALTSRDATSPQHGQPGAHPEQQRLPEPHHSFAPQHDAPHTGPGHTQRPPLHDSPCPQLLDAVHELVQRSATPAGSTTHATPRATQSSLRFHTPW
jgi:hypothetical protein